MNWKQRFLQPPSLQDWVIALQAWRLWLVGGLLGALLGAGLFSLKPPPFRARAEVVVDYNLEEAWPEATDRKLFQYLARENKKLHALAWSDEVLERTAAGAGVPLSAAWRQGQFTLRDEHDGRWHFWVTAASPDLAQQLARSWAQAFTEVTRERVEVALRLLSDRAALQEIGKQLAALETTCASAEAPSDCEQQRAALEQRRTALEEEIAEVEQASAGILPYIEVSFAQAEALPVERRTSRAAYALTGALVGVLLALAWALGFGGARHEG